MIGFDGSVCDENLLVTVVLRLPAAAFKLLATVVLCWLAAVLVDILLTRSASSPSVERSRCVSFLSTSG